MFVFFFFQAEDGIRDRDVTGVQTCALPISIVVSAVQVAGDLVGLAGAEDEGVVGEVEIGGAGQVQMVVERDLAQSRFELGRSEERRVGKEGRSRGSRGEEKEKGKKRA